MCRLPAACLCLLWLNYSLSLEVLKDMVPESRSRTRMASSPL